MFLIYQKKIIQMMIFVLTYKINIIVANLSMIYYMIIIKIKKHIKFLMDLNNFLNL